MEDVWRGLSSSTERSLLIIGRGLYQGLSLWTRGLPAGWITGMIVLGSWLIPREGGSPFGISPRLCSWRPICQPYP